MNDKVIYSIGMKVGNALSSLSQLKDGIKSIGNVLGTELSSRMVKAFGITAIIAATVKTAEYEKQLQSTAQTLGTTAEKVQAMDFLGNITNIDSSKLTGWFDTLDEKRKEALQGNVDLAQSFAAMNIKYSDLQNATKSDLFSKVLTNQNLQNVERGTPMGIAVEKLLGNNSLPLFKRVQKAEGFQNLDTYTNGLKQQGLILDNEDVASFTESWNAFKISLTKFFIQMEPILKILLRIASKVLKYSVNENDSSNVNWNSSLYAKIKAVINYEDGVLKKHGIIGNKQTDTTSVTGGSSSTKDVSYYGVVMRQAPTVFTGESLSQLKTGGIFDSGIQTRMVQLNQEMVRYLSMIAQNTSIFNNPYARQSTPLNNNRQRNAGGR